MTGYRQWIMQFPEVVSFITWHRPEYTEASAVEVAGKLAVGFIKKVECRAHGPHCWIAFDPIDSNFLVAEVSDDFTPAWQEGITRAATWPASPRQERIPSVSQANGKTRPQAVA